MQVLEMSVTRKFVAQQSECSSGKTQVKAWKHLKDFMLSEKM